MKLAGIGFRHGHVWEMVNGLRKAGKAELLALAEDHEECRARAVEKYPDAARFTDWRRMLDEVEPDCVTLVTTNDVKGPVIVECLRRGISVFADKPLFLSESDLDEAESAYADSGGRAVLGALLSVRHHGPHWTARKLMRDGRIGRIAQAYASRPHKLGPSGRQPWELTNTQNGGVLIDLAIHDVDYLMWVMGSEPVEVTGYIGLFRYTDLADFWDSGQMMVRMSDGGTILIEADWLTPDASPWHGDCRMMITGTEGFIEMHEATGRVLLTTNASGTEEVAPADDVPSLCEDFVLQMAGEGALLSTEEVFRVSRVCLAATASARAGGCKVTL